MLLGEVEPQILAGLVARALPGGAGQSLLLGHGGVEAGAVDVQAAGAQRVLGQIIGEAEGVVELEGGLAGQGAALAHLRGRLVEQLQAIGQRLAEACLLLRQRRFDQRLGADQLGVSGAHFGDQRRHQAVHQRLLGAEDKCAWRMARRMIRRRT